MKKRKAKALSQPLAAAELASNFTRGMVAAGLLTAIQDRGSVGMPPNRKVVRLALQGGVALAAGAATADSLRKRDYLGAMVAFASGAVGVMALEAMLTSETPETYKTPEPIEEADVG